MIMYYIYNLLIILFIVSSEAASDIQYNTNYINPRIYEISNIHISDEKTNSTPVLVCNLHSTNIHLTHISYVELIIRNTNSIPYLIDNITNTNIHYGFTFSINKYNRNWDMKIGKMPAGMISAYLIECILKNTTSPYGIPCINKKGIFSNYEIYDSYYKHAGKIQAIYKKWWNRNKNNSLAEIREKDIDPLAHSQYEWEGYDLYLHYLKDTSTNKTSIPEENPKERKSILERFLSIFR